MRFRGRLLAPDQRHQFKRFATAKDAKDREGHAKDFQYLSDTLSLRTFASLAVSLPRSSAPKARAIPSWGSFALLRISSFQAGKRISRPRPARMPQWTPQTVPTAELCG
jgi:hypothetical protein